MERQRLIKTICIITMINCFTGCGMSLRTNIIDVPDVVTAAEINEPVFYWIDDHKATKKSADKAFDAYAKKAFQGDISWRVLMSVKPEKTRVTMTYDTQLKDGTLARITLSTKNFKTGYKKKHKQTDKAYVNGKQYEFRH